jgi:hypothetical protein
MFYNFRNLAVTASECQRNFTAHNPELSDEQALLAEKLALEQASCQFCCTSLTGGAKRDEPVSTCGKPLPLLPISTHY